MARAPTSKDDHPGSTPGSDHAMPGWVKAFVAAGVIVVVVVVLVVSILAIGGESHGPDRHRPETTRILDPVPTHVASTRLSRR